MSLPTFSVDGMTLIKRMAWVIDDGVIAKLFYPVFPPDQSAAQVIAWLQAIQISAHARKHRAKHLRRQHAGVGVVARAVIAGEQRERPDLRAAAMAERGLLQLVAQRAHRRLVRDAPQRDDGAQLRHLRDGGFEKIPAGVDLRRRRLVLRRHAAHAVGDAGVDQFETVIRPRLEHAAGEAVFLQRRVEQVAGIVAGERPPGAVGAAHAGGEADDQQPCAQRPERGHRRVEPGRLLGAPFLAERHEARAARAVAPGLAGRHRRGASFGWCRHDSPRELPIA